MRIKCSGCQVQLRPCTSGTKKVDIGWRCPVCGHKIHTSVRGSEIVRYVFRNSDLKSEVSWKRTVEVTLSIGNS